MSNALGIMTKHYFSPQSDFETGAAPEGADGVKLKTALVFSKTQNAEPRLDYHPGTRDILEEATFDVKVGMSAGAYIVGGMQQGQTPGMAAAYQTAFTEAAIAATTVAASPSPTTSTFALTDDYLVAGQIGKIENTAGEKRYFVVVEKDGSDTLTIFPPLENAPVAGDAVKAVVNYRLAHTNTQVVTCHRSDNLVGEMGVGGKFHKYTWRFAKGQSGELTMEGQCRDVIRSMHTTLDGQIDDSQTSVTVDGAGMETGAILQCESERMLVTDVNETTPTLMTVTRGYDGTTPTSHADETAIGPCEPEASVSGALVRGLYGGVWLDDDGSFIKCDEVTVSVDEKTEYVGYFGDGGKAKATANPEDREIIWEMVCYLDESAVEKIRAVTASQSLKCFCQAGQEDGCGAAFYSPRVLFATPEIPDSKGELVKVTLTSRVVLGQDGEDSFAFAF